MWNKMNIRTIISCFTLGYIAPPQYGLFPQNFLSIVITHAHIQRCWIEIRMKNAGVFL